MQIMDVAVRRNMRHPLNLFIEQDEGSLWMYFSPQRLRSHYTCHHDDILHARKQVANLHPPVWNNVHINVTVWFPSWNMAIWSH